MKKTKQSLFQLRSKRRMLSTLILLVSVGLTDAARASVIVVTNTDDDGPGSLRRVVTDAANGDEIRFAPALTGSTITLTSGWLDIEKNLSIIGPGAANLTIAGGLGTGIQFGTAVQEGT